MPSTTTYRRGQVVVVKLPDVIVCAVSSQQGYLERPGPVDELQRPLDFLQDVLGRSRASLEVPCKPRIRLEESFRVALEVKVGDRHPVSRGDDDGLPTTGSY